MRSHSPPAPWHVGLLVGAVLCVLAPGASAQRGTPPTTPAPRPPGAGAGRAGQTQASVQIQDAIFPTASPGARPPWRILGLYELHFNAWSDEYSANDWYSLYRLRGDRNLTEHDQVSLRMDLEQKYIADPGESGLWFGDMRFYYSRMFELPIRSFEIPAKASLYITAPTSRVSYRRGYITKPTAALTLAPKWGPLSLEAICSLRYSFAWYAESYGGDPNLQWTAELALQAFFAVTDWLAPSVSYSPSWSLPYETREGEGRPIVEEYYWEAAINVSVPMPEQAPTVDLSLAWAQGANVLEGGVYRLYIAKRNQSEIYAAINLTY